MRRKEKATGESSRGVLADIRTHTAEKHQTRQNNSAQSCEIKCLSFLLRLCLPIKQQDFDECGTNFRHSFHFHH
jgi:hypothetical protein